tara:strand:+ start:1005 stop:1382 length:378 start_codon:yes stop_codon:yes gene_type:complete
VSGKGVNRYYLLQLSILLVPAAAFTSIFQVNDWIISVSEEYFFYIAGVLPLFSLGLFAESILKPAVGESMAFTIAIGVYITCALFIFRALYRPRFSRQIGVSAANLFLSLWSLMVGHFFMFLAMQ